MLGKLDPTEIPRPAVIERTVIAPVPPIVPTEMLLSAATVTVPPAESEPALLMLDPAIDSAPVGAMVTPLAILSVPAAFRSAPARLAIDDEIVRLPPDAAANDPPELITVPIVMGAAPVCAMVAEFAPIEIV